MGLTVEPLWATIGDHPKRKAKVALLINYLGVAAKFCNGALMRVRNMPTQSSVTNRRIIIVKQLASRVASTLS